MARIGIGLQLFTLRDNMAQDMEGTLRHVAKLGYEGVEFAGYYGMEAESLKQLLDEIGLKAIASHVSLDNLKNNLQGEIDYLRTLGAKYIICPYVAEDQRQTAEQWQQIIADCEAIAAEAKKQGLQFLYHNHDFEFHVKIDGQFVFDAMYAKTGENAINVEMDVCWVQFAGQDPLAYIAKYAGRLPLVHFKDFSKDADGKIVTLELGQGNVDLEKVITAAEQAGVEWLIVEQDHCQNPPLTSIANSLNWVKEHYTSVRN
ncbi:sugar phosphate isomerase/epimerase family protein [Paenibacillus sp. GCM10027628]|uniref:sugar phosphate isomerase/epimerase family protein n=1 Tax=Paenibacillus sp. GCM10027628 TaxID=3273413 RepID=UPI0036258113